MKLPTEAELLLKAALSLTKKARIAEAVELPKLEFSFHDFDNTHINKFAGLVGFSSALSAPYLYLYFQRAQLALMTQKQFPLAVPGLIHVYNELLWVKRSTLSKLSDLSISVSGKCELLDNEDIAVKLRAELLAADGKIAICTSKYVKKAPKSAVKKAKTIFEERDFTKWRRQEVFIPKSTSWKYAQTSGDYNPIHLNDGLAKIFGMRKSIVHGWFAVCIALSKLSDSEIDDLQVSFKKPISWNESCQLLSHTQENTVHFEVWNQTVSHPKLIGSFRKTIG